MVSLPSMICFVNGDLTYPPTPPPNPPDLDVFIGSQPNLPQSDASVSELTNLQIQLFINDTMTKEEFDKRMYVDKNYATILHLRNIRILVILPSFHDHYNREYADVVIFLKQGLANVERNRLAWPGRGCPEDRFEEFPANKFLSSTYQPDGYRHCYPSYPRDPRNGFAVGPPGQCYDMQRLNMYELLRAGHHDGECRLPFGFGEGKCGECGFGRWCDRCHSSSGQRLCYRCGCDCRCGCNVDIGLYDNQGRRISPLELPNCDRESNNPAFIYRK
jgi:hypothetical protein